MKAIPCYSTVEEPLTNCGLLLVLTYLLVSMVSHSFHYGFSLWCSFLAIWVCLKIGYIPNEIAI